MRERVTVVKLEPVPVAYREAGWRRVNGIVALAHSWTIGESTRLQG